MKTQEKIMKGVKNLRKLKRGQLFIVMNDINNTPYIVIDVDYNKGEFFVKNKKTMELSIMHSSFLVYPIYDVVSQQDGIVASVFFDNKRGLWYVGVSYANPFSGYWENFNTLIRKMRNYYGKIKIRIKDINEAG